jgi:hypothetical protein
VADHVVDSDVADWTVGRVFFLEAGMMLLSFLRAVPIIDYAARDYRLAASASGDASDL